MPTASSPAWRCSPRRWNWNAPRRRRRCPPEHDQRPRGSPFALSVSKGEDGKDGASHRPGHARGERPLENILKFAFIVDPLEKLKPYKDSSVAMMREASRRGHEIWAIQREQLAWEGGSVSAQAVRIVPQADNAAWYTAHETQTWALQE